RRESMETLGALLKGAVSLPDIASDVNVGNGSPVLHLGLEARGDVQRCRGRKRHRVAVRRVYEHALVTGIQAIRKDDRAGSCDANVRSAVAGVESTVPGVAVDGGEFR